MKEFRLGRNTTAHYTSFEEMAKSWGCKPVSKKTKDENKLESQKQKFVNKHKCRGCGCPMTWIGGNMMACTNDKCKGIKHEFTDKTGELKIYYETSFDLLDELGEIIANNIFGD